jgi:AraC family transcriptional regulator
MEVGKDDLFVLAQPRFETIRLLRVAGLLGHYKPATAKAIPAQWQRLDPYRDVLDQIGAVEYGLCFDRADGFDYLSGIAVPDVSAIPPELHSATIENQRCAVFPHDGRASELWRTIRAIYGYWLPKSGFKALALPGSPTLFERYGEAFDPVTGTGDIEVWLPIAA